MRRSVAGFVVSLFVLVPATVGSAVPISPAPVWSPDASWSSDGDYATDTYGDPWDFANDADVLPVSNVGAGFDAGVSRTGDILNVNTVAGTSIRLVFNWPNVLPWGRDGSHHPVDATRYTRFSFRICADGVINSLGVRWENTAGVRGTIPLTTVSGCQDRAVNLLDPANYPFPSEPGPWSGQVVRFEIFRGGEAAMVPVHLDWARLHRADTPDAPTNTPPRPVVLSPSEEGGADFATSVRGNPWDMSGPDDVWFTNQLANTNYANGNLNAQSVGNDPFVAMHLGASAIDGDRFHRATIDACYDGGFSLADAAGGGMVGRLIWSTTTIPGDLTETQDFVVFPGCHRMTFDLETAPATAVHDESSATRPGWSGQSINVFRFDPEEDRGVRAISVNEIKLAADDAFTSTFPIRFADNAFAGGTTADIFVSTSRGALGGTQIASVPVVAGVNTFTWNGRSTSNAPLPNGTYWVTIRMTRGAQRTTAAATGPLSYEPAIPTGPGYYVPVTPARILDTRDGTGGVISRLGAQEDLELQIAGVGGVPATGVRGVVMNLGADSGTAESYLTVWPSGEARPGNSNVNFAAGQSIPNLVAVKVGANGKVNVYNNAGLVNVIADVVGYYTDVRPQSGGLFTTLTPARVLDTRLGTGRGGVVGPVGAQQVIDLQVTGVGGVPTSGVSGVAINISADVPTAAGYLTVYPTGEGLPLAASHNFVPGITVANLVLAKVGTGGRISIYNSAGSTQVVGDVIGYFSSSGGQFVPLSPSRLLDTRDGTGRGGFVGPLGPGEAFNVPIGGVGGVPSNASGAVLNVTAANATVGTFITVWPTGVVRPFTATLNPRPGPAVPNLAYAKLGAGGQVSMFNAGGTVDLIADVFGYVI
jgi:hypothetical protein